jgi:uroporphyrinogen decarboxylase
MQTSRAKALSILNRENADCGVMWTGHPNEKTVPIYAEEWGIEPTPEAIFQYLEDDCRWFSADSGYKHPEGRPMWDYGYGVERGRTLSAAGCFAEIEDVKALESYPWPDARHCDFTDVYKKIDQFQDKMVFTGMWSPFFHTMHDFFGMENYFCKMYTDPEVIEAATEKITDFFVAANEKFFGGLGNRADVMFFGNDFGTQNDLFISPENFRKFILPAFKRLIAVGKKYGKKIMLHSCGSVYRIIPDLIDAGVDILHPIQARAAGMSAKDLARFKNDLSFVGGIDAQTFFVNAAPAQIEEEVKRVRALLGPGLVVSPSHEEILPNVPAANVAAMARAAHTPSA